MIFVKSVDVLKNYNNLPEGLKIDLTDLVVLVGDQGCGKSTLLKLLADNDKTKLNISLAFNRYIPSYYFDTENMNPRIRDAQLYSTPSGEDKGIGVCQALLSRWKSHGDKDL